MLQEVGEGFGTNSFSEIAECMGWLHSGYSSTVVHIMATLYS